MALIIPRNYDPLISPSVRLREANQIHSRYISRRNSEEMHLERISAPLFVTQSDGLN